MGNATARKVRAALSEINWNTKTPTDFLPSEWTQDIKARLSQLGFNEGFSVWTSGVPESESGAARIANQEWLFDMVWINYSESGLNRTMKSLPLALESELPLQRAAKYEKVLEDFEKLIVSRAELKVMIFQVDNCSEAEDTFCKLEQHVGGFRSPMPDGDYLLVSIVWQKGKILFHQFGQTKG